MADDTRTYNVPLRKEYMKAPKYKRSKRAITAVRSFLTRHMKSDTILISKDLNEHIWKDGIKNPPHHVKVIAIRDKEGRISADLAEKKIGKAQKIRLEKEKKSEEKAVKAKKKKEEKIEEEIAESEKELHAEEEIKAEEEAKPVKTESAQKPKETKAEEPAKTESSEKPKESAYEASEKKSDAKSNPDEKSS
jgi:large subunit ribosomal protein L31e